MSSNSELRGQLGGRLAPGVLAAKASKQGLVLAPVDLVAPARLATSAAGARRAPRGPGAPTGASA